MPHLHPKVMSYIEKLVVEIGPRLIGSPANQAAADFIRDTFPRCRSASGGATLPLHRLGGTISAIFEADGISLLVEANVFSPACDVQRRARCLSAPSPSWKWQRWKERSSSSTVSWPARRSRPNPGSCAGPEDENDLRPARRQASQPPWSRRPAIPAITSRSPRIGTCPSRLPRCRARSCWSSCVTPPAQFI